MTINTKAALLSALLFPGCGQWLKSQRWLALGFMAVAIVPLYGIVTQILVISQQLTEQIVAGEIALDAMSLMTAMSAHAPTAGQNLSFLSGIFMVNWLVSVIHAYVSAPRNKASIVA